VILSPIPLPWRERVGVRGKNVEKSGYHLSIHVLYLTHCRKQGFDPADTVKSGTNFFLEE